MSKKEYTVIEILDISRRYKAGDSIRAIPKATGIARNTVRNYIRSAVDKGFATETDVDLEAIAYEVFKEIHADDNTNDCNIRDGILLPHKKSIAEWLERDRLTITKAHIKLLRTGVKISYSSLYRFVHT